MLDTPFSSERLPVQAKESASAKRELLARRSGAPADQLMHAWSISATRPNAGAERVNVRGKEDCPPEVYIG